MLAHVPSFGQNPRSSREFLVHPVPKACQRRILGTWVPRCLGLARSASSPKAAEDLGRSPNPRLRTSFGRVTCMARAASVAGPWTLGFLMLCGARAWVWRSSSPGFSWFAILVRYVLGFRFPPALFRSRLGLAVCAVGCGLHLFRACFGSGLVRMCSGACCQVGGGYEGRNVAHFLLFLAGSCGSCRGRG